MTLSRRGFIIAGAAGLVAACGAPGAAPVAAQQTTFRAVPNPAFDAWLAGFRTRAAARGISDAVLSRALSRAGYLPDVIDRDRNQTEFRRSLEDYLAIAASEERIRDGRAALGQWGNVLREIEARFGVEAHVLTAVWGLESRYGTRRGDVPVVSATATLAFDGRRGEFFEKQLTAALRILQNGDTTPDRMVGSWAGAMGHTQFIPTTYEAFAVDFRGDGRRDIWADDPTDALASSANYLARSGWRRGQPWGLEVRLPQGFNPGLTGRGTTRAVASWADLGVQAAGGGRLPDAGAGSILAPAGVAAPALLVFHNFGVILRYNNAENYGVGIGHLSDRINGGAPIRGSFGADATGLTIDDRKELQTRLTAAGFDTGGADGVIGSRSTAAIEAYQRASGLPVTGQPSPALLQSLRQ